MAVNKLIRYVVFTFNLLFFLCGLIILGLSLHVRSNRTDYQITEELLLSINLLIFIGAVTLVFGFLGCCGAIKESRCLPALFFTGLFCVFLSLLAVGVLGAISRTAAAQTLVREQMKTLIPLSEQPRTFQESFRGVERTSKCCGLFSGHPDWGNGSAAVPDSCNCNDASRNCTVVDGRRIYSTPCLSQVMTWLSSVSASLTGTAFAFATAMVLGLALSVTVYQIRKSRSFI